MAKANYLTDEISDFDKNTKVLINNLRKMIFAKLIFSPPKKIISGKIFLFQNTKKFWLEKNLLNFFNILSTLLTT
jgi:hypothetical protein